MIDSVRNTVLSILNKANFGYITPSDFNLYARQAQLSLFEDYFYKYNQQINKENARTSGTQYADIRKTYEEVIDTFSVSNALSHNAYNKFFMPSLTTTGDQYFMLNTVIAYPTELASGSSTSDSASKLVDSGANFITSGVSEFDIVANVTTGNVSMVTAVTATELTLRDNIFTSNPEVYAVYDRDSLVEVDKVGNKDANLMNINMLAEPSNTFPVYVHRGDSIEVYPRTINKFGAIEAQYIRYPYDPKWTYVSLSGGEPSFDPTDNLYQDFELPKEDEVDLTIKILQMAGMSIRELEVVRNEMQKEMINDQKEQ